MGIIDIVVLVLLILSILIGFFRGFKRKHLYSFASTIGCALGYLAGIPLAHALMGTNLGSTTLTNAYRKTRSDTGIFGEPVALTPSERTTQLHSALSELKVPSKGLLSIMSLIFQELSQKRLLLPLLIGQGS